jgi:hypothetical protein
VDDESGLALLRDRLRDPFGGFSGRVVAEFLPDAGAYDPVVEVVVRDNVNSSCRHRLNSAKRDDWEKIGDGALTSVNSAPLKKSGEADGRQWLSAPCAARYRLRIHKPMIARVQSSKGPTSRVMDTGSGVSSFRSADVGQPG